MVKEDGEWRVTEWRMENGELRVTMAGHRPRLRLREPRKWRGDPVFSIYHFAFMQIMMTR